MMSKITEEDVLNYYMPLILEECKNSYKGLEWEDRIEEAKIALLHAIRTYTIFYGCFEGYFITQLRIIMKKKNAEAWASKKIDSQFSLDALFVSGNDKFTLTECLGTTFPYDSMIDVKCFMDSLSPDEKVVLHLLMNNYNVHAISKILTMPLTQVQSTLDHLKVKIAAYYYDDLYLRQ